MPVWSLVTGVSLFQTFPPCCTAMAAALCTCYSSSSMAAAADAVPFTVVEMFPSVVCGAAATEDGGTVVAVSRDGTLGVLRRCGVTYSVVQRVELGMECRDVALRPDGAVVAVLGHWARVVVVLRRRSDGQYEECQRIGSPDSPRFVAISPPGTIVCGSAIRGIMVYECGGGVVGVYEETQRLHGVVRALITVDDSVLIAVSRDLIVYGRTAADRPFEEQQRLPAVCGGAVCHTIAVSTDGGTVVVGSNVGGIAFVVRRGVGVWEEMSAGA